MNTPKTRFATSRVAIGVVLFVMLLGVLFLLFRSPSDLSNSPNLAGHVQGLGVLTVELGKVKLKTREARIRMEDLQERLKVPPDVAVLADISSLPPDDQQRYKLYFDARKDYEVAKLIENTISRRIGSEVRDFPAAPKK